MHILYLGWFTTVAVVAYIYYVITKDLGAAGYFGLLVGYVGGILGNLLLSYVDSESYYVEGFLDALWKKFFWKHGPQFFGFILCGIYGYALYKEEFNFKEALTLAFGYILMPIVNALGK